MLLTVKKQTEETLEVKTPCYYKTVTGYHFITETGLVSAGSRMISMWGRNDGKYFNEEVERIVNNGKPCNKEEYEKAYAKILNEMNLAVGLAEINS